MARTGTLSCTAYLRDGESAHSAATFSLKGQALTESASWSQISIIPKVVRGTHEVSDTENSRLKPSTLSREANAALMMTFELATQ